jgi:hypothetical protein
LEIFFWLQLFWLGIKYVFLALYSSIITVSIWLYVYFINVFFLCPDRTDISNQNW